MNRLIILTGASGSGKTTIAREITKRSTDEFKVLHFDDIGVPAVSEMIKEFGSQEEWQRHHTKEWLTRISKDILSQTSVLFEGQMRISFLKEDIELCKLENSAKIYLVDCTDEERFKRLRFDRGQPDLCTDDMRNWAAYLRKEAIHSGIEILDTTLNSVDLCVKKISSKLTGVVVTQMTDTATLESVVPLFDEYRQFYDQPSDMEGANKFLTERFEKAESILFLSTVDGTPSGFCQLYPSYSSVSMKRLWILNDLFVSKDFRKQGVAKHLLDACVQFAATTKSKGLVLETAITNLPAQKLYELAGWIKDTDFYRFHYLV